MTKKKIKINFYNFYPRFKHQYWFNRFPWLKEDYEFVISKDPDVAIIGAFNLPGGRTNEGIKKALQRLPKKAIKFFYTTENFKINVNKSGADFVISSRTDYSHSNYLRVPSWLPIYNVYKVQGKDLIKRLSKEEINQINKPRFCNFIYSHNVPFRNEFFKKLSKYKKVDAPSRCMNNMRGIGRTHQDKIDFVDKYKFTIAFENSSSPGYVTEKMVDPIMVNSIPIYWGNPEIHKEFNTKSIFNWFDYDKVDELVEAIIEVDKDDEKYRQMLSEPWFPNNEEPECLNQDRIKKFMKKVFG